MNKMLFVLSLIYLVFGTWIFSSGMRPPYQEQEISIETWLENVNKTIKDMEYISEGITKYLAEKGKLPRELDPGTACEWVGRKLYDVLVPKYITNPPSKDVWGNLIWYSTGIRLSVSAYD